jgi:capsular polysaccharide biosynthesis protein
MTPGPDRPTLQELTPTADVEPRVGVESQPRGALESYLRAVRAHRLLVAVVVLATLLASIVWLSQRTPEYKATARLLVNPLPQTDELLGLPVIRDSGEPTRTMQTAASVLESPRAAEATASRLGADWTAQQVLTDIDLQPAGESNILAVTARTDTSGKAVDLANTFARSTLATRDAALRQDAAPLIDRLKKTRASLGTSDPSATDIESRIVALEGLAIGGDPSTGLSRLAASASAEGAPGWLIVCLALFAGLVLASVAALLKEALGPATIRSESELEDVHAEPVLARVPSRGRIWPGQEPPSPLATPGEVLTSFRSLELQLDERHSAILFTSPSTRDGTTTCVIDFALELASADREVILLDLDLRKPELARRLGADGKGDLGAVLRPHPALAEALVPVPDRPAIKVLPGIKDPGRATLEKVGERLPELIAQAGTRNAYVLIDTSPLGEFGDALRFAPAVDHILLVARLDHTRVAGVQEVRDLLERAGTPARGYVVVEGASALPRMSWRLPSAVIAPPVRESRERPAHETVARPGASAATRSIGDLVEAGLLPHDAELVASSNGQTHVAYLRGGQVDLNGTRYGSLSAAAASITGKATNGWTFWRTRIANEYVPLADLRKQLPPQG